MNTKYKTPDTIHKIEELDMSAKYSYADYLQWKFEERVEIIKGRVFQLAAPRRKHQEVSAELFIQLKNHINNSKCKAYFAPFDVRLPISKDEKKTETVVQPDICIICNPEILDEKGCNGAPDLIVEILSPSTSEKDATIKFDLYEEVGVKEYWMVYPELNLLDVFLLNDKRKYQFIRKYAAIQKVPVNILEGCRIDLEKVFQD
jgi:Uma2 family endonuclease